MQPPNANYEQLSTAEKILRLQDEWDRIAENPDAIELTDAQRKELDVRLAAAAASPDDTTSWDAVVASVRAGR
jgi:putative addiction module component (TIGR02574 family)